MLMTRRFLLAGLSISLIGSSCVREQHDAQHPISRSKPAGITFFVATNGNDSWSGKLSLPNRSGSDGPFASPDRAVLAARERRGQSNPSAHPVTIVIRGGRYFLSEPLRLRGEDSGIVVANYRKEQPVLSGGRQIGPWKERDVAGKKIWVEDVPETKEGNWFFRELWVNGSRATRARHPNKGYLHIESLPDSTPQWSVGQTRFKFHEADLKPWPSLTNAEVLAMTRWVESRLPIIELDETQRVV